jgi:hypothetical protein
MRRTIRRKSKPASGIFARALTKVDKTTRRDIFKPGELKEWLTYSKRYHDSNKLAHSMRAIVEENKLARKQRSR